MLSERLTQRITSTPKEAIWMITFLDLLTLLLTFFVLRISMKTLPAYSNEVITHTASAEIATEEADLRDLEQKELPQPTLTQSTRAALSSKINLNEYGTGESSTELSVPFANPLFDTSDIKSDLSEGKRRVLFSRDTFLPDSATLNFSAASALNAIAELAQERKLSIHVVGYSDSSPINSKEFPSNWELAQARTMAAVRQMLDAGVDATAISVAAYGNNLNKTDGITARANPLDRRLEVFIEEKNPL